MDKDIKFDAYGDFEIIGNDIGVLQDEKDIIYQNVIDRLISNFGDYALNERFGADLSSCIGKSNDEEIEEDVHQRIINALTKDGLIFPSQLSVLVLKKEHKVFIKISILSKFQGSLIEEFSINTIFNLASGMLYVTNWSQSSIRLNGTEN